MQVLLVVLSRVVLELLTALALVDKLLKYDDFIGFCDVFCQQHHEKVLNCLLLNEEIVRTE